MEKQRRPTNIKTRSESAPGGATNKRGDGISSVSSLRAQISTTPDWASRLPSELGIRQPPADVCIIAKIDPGAGRAGAGGRWATRISANGPYLRRPKPRSWPHTRIGGMSVQTRGRASENSARSDRSSRGSRSVFSADEHHLRSMIAATTLAGRGNLIGPCRRSCDKVRVNAPLIDAETDAHLGHARPRHFTGARPAVGFRSA